MNHQFQQQEILCRKQKILDYEIETAVWQAASEKPHQSRKQKILDYEIETHCFVISAESNDGVENRRFSITRLKP